MEVIEKGQAKMPDVGERIRFGGDLLAYGVRYVYGRRGGMVERETAGSVVKSDVSASERRARPCGLRLQNIESRRARPPLTTRTARSEKKLLSNMTRAAIGSGRPT
jgi:hypothetical protein